MQSRASGLDGYTIKARYLPALIVVLPLWLAFAVWFPPDKEFLGVFASAGGTLVLGALLAQIGRDAGKRRQKDLFKEWGGVPTTRALAFRSRVVNGVTLARYHAALNERVPGLALPQTEEEEKADWKAAKEKYESAADYLRDATRDKSKYRMVYAENVNYGFRRNLWGMKPGALLIGALTIAAIAIRAFMKVVSGENLGGLDAASLLLCVGLFALWCLRFTKSWVRLAADAYALQLLATCELLGSGRSSETTAA